MKRQVPSLARRAMPWAAALAFVLALAPAQAQEIDAKQFRDLYAEATAKLAAYYDRTGMVIDYRRKFKTAQPEKYKSWEISARYLYKASAPLYLLETTDEKRGTEDVVDRVDLVDGRGVARLEKSAPSRGYQLDRFYENVAEGRDVLHERAMAPRAAFSIGSVRLLDEIAHPKKTIRKCVRRKRIGADHYIIEYDWLGRNDIRIDCRFVLDADRCLAVLEHTTTSPGSSHEHRVEYEGEANGVPLVQRVTRIQKDPSGSATQTWEVRAHLPGPFPESDFSPVTWIGRDRSGRGGRLALVCLLATGAVGLVGALLYWRLRRARARDFG